MVSTVDPREYPTLASLGFNLTKFLFDEIRSGKLVGVHYEGPPGGYIRGIQRARGLTISSRTSLDSHGVYEADVAKKGARGSKTSGFFPTSWDLSELLRELDYALKPEKAGGGLYKRAPAGSGGLTFEGRTSSGITIRAYANEKYGLDTIFPLYQRR